MLSLAIFGGSTVDGGSLDPGEPITALAMFGGAEIDFSAGPPPPYLDITAVAVFGGVTVKVHPKQVVRLSGLSIFGGKSVEPRQLTDETSAGDEDFEDPLEIRAFSMFGGVAVKRWVPGQGDEEVDA